MSARRRALIRLVAQIDQQIADARSLAADKRLSQGERLVAKAELEFRQKAIKQVEAMLGVG